MNRQADDEGELDTLWSAQARQYNKLGPPLRVSWEDVALYQGEVNAWSKTRHGTPPRALVLGVTPELPSFRWPTGSRVHAVDKSWHMIDRVWDADAQYAAAAVAATWQRLPFAPQSMDLVLGDGCFSFCRWPAGYRELLDAIAGVLRPGGRVVMRTYLSPVVGESVDEIVADLAAGRIGTFTMFKWRLVTAVHGDSEDGVRLGDVWDAWHATGLDPRQVAEDGGWSIRVVKSIDSYRGQNARYSIPRFDALQALLSEDARFRQLACHRPGYEMGDRFRVFVLERLD